MSSATSVNTEIRVRAAAAALAGLANLSYPAATWDWANSLRTVPCRQWSPGPAASGARAPMVLFKLAVAGHGPRHHLKMLSTQLRKSYDGQKADPYRRSGEMRHCRRHVGPGRKISNSG